MKMQEWYLLVMVLLAALVTIPAASRAQQNQPAAAAGPVEAQAQAAIPVLPAADADAAPASEQEGLARKVRHKLVRQPEYSIWDWLVFRVNGRTVELLGDASSGGLKQAAINTVSGIDGVDKVVDHITRLPLSADDDRIRHKVADAIYTQGSLSRYAWSATPTIHIIVGSGQVRLEGVVDNQPDKDEAALRAKGVEGVLNVTNHLSIESD